MGLWGLSAGPASGSSGTLEAEPNSMLWIGDVCVLVHPGLPGWMARSSTDIPALAAGWAHTPWDGLCLLQLLWGEKRVDVTLGAFWLSVRASLGCCDSPFWLQPCRVQEQKVPAAGPAQASQAYAEQRKVTVSATREGGGGLSSSGHMGREPVSICN